MALVSVFFIIKYDFHLTWQILEGKNKIPDSITITAPSKTPKHPQPLTSPRHRHCKSSKISELPKRSTPHQRYQNIVILPAFKLIYGFHFWGLESLHPGAPLVDYVLYQGFLGEGGG